MDDSLDQVSFPILIPRMRLRKKVDSFALHYPLNAFLNSPFHPSYLLLGPLKTPRGQRTTLQSMLLR